MIIIGHRGARAAAPENTIRAILAGMKCAEFVEVDARLSRDRIPVIMHDPDVDRTTNGRGRVGEMTFEEIQALDAGGGEHVPSLRDVCTRVKGQCGLCVEIKEPGSEWEICAVLDQEAASPLWIVSFHHGILEVIPEMLADAVTGFIYSRPFPDAVGFAVRKHQQALLPRFDLLTPELVHDAHARGVRVVPWTLNTPEDWANARGMGVDGFATDDPCAARRWLGTGDPATQV